LGFLLGELVHYFLMFNISEQRKIMNACLLIEEQEPLPIIYVEQVIEAVTKESGSVGVVREKGSFGFRDRHRALHVRLPQS
jgi:hypothetical protein